MSENPTPKPPEEAKAGIAINEQIVRTVLERLDKQYPRKGVKRDEAAINCMAGALACQMASGEDTNLSFVVWMTSVRGASYLNDYLKTVASFEPTVEAAPNAEG